MAIPPFYEGTTHPFGQGAGRPGFKPCPTEPRVLRYVDRHHASNVLCSLTVTDKVSDKGAFYLPVHFILSPVRFILSPVRFILSSRMFHSVFLYVSFYLPGLWWAL